MRNVQDIAQQAEAWVLGTYRRMDALDVPAFSVRDTSGLVPGRTSRRARLHRLSTALPREIRTLADWLDVDGAGAGAGLSDPLRLSLLLRYLSSPLRYEPGNVYQVHRAVPSARCMFPIDLLLTHVCRDGVRRTYLYHPDFHALEEVDAPEGGEGHAVGGHTTITGIGRFWKMVRKYGDFSLFPVMLEAGMVLAQLRHLRGALGWEGRAADPDAMRSFCEGELEFPVFSETIGQPSCDPVRLPVEDVVLAVHEASTAGVPRFGRLPLFMSLFDRPPGPVQATTTPAGVPVASDLVPPGRGFLETLRLRHSANDMVGMAPRTDGEAGLLHDLARLAQRIGGRRGRVAGEERLHTVMLWPGRVAPACGIYDGGGGLLAELDRRRLAALLEQALPSPGLRYNLQAHSLLVLFLADPHGEGMQEPSSFRDAHVAAGALAQDWCLAAAALGRFARPVRMLREQVLESALPVEGQIVYSLLCGSNRATNVCAELL